MKIITKRLKNLTLFDKAIIIIAVLGVILFAYVFFRKATYITATVKVGEEDIRYQPWFTQVGSRVWFSELFYVGMQEKDGLGKVNAEVEKIYSYNASPETKALYLTLKLKAVYSRAQNQYTYKGNPVLIGYPIKMFIDRLYVEGLVISIEGIADLRERQNLIVEAKLIEESPTFPETSGVKEYIAEAIKVGDKAKDNNGETIIEILEKRVESAKKVVTTSDGRVVVQRQPLKRDVYLTLGINAIKIADRYFVFDDIPILVGLEIPINTSKYFIQPQVASFEVK